MPYLKAAKAAMGGQYRFGVYGPGSVCSAASDASIASLTWLSNAMGWRGSKAYRDSKKWNILQHLPQTVAGIDVDPDEINAARSDIGDFVPFAVPVPGIPGVKPLSPTGFDDPDPGAGSDIRDGVVTAKAVNLRAKASASSAILGTLEQGTPVKIYSEVMNGPTKWLKIDGGYVAARYVDVDV
jgi:uncharacterized protein YgiM (DUF1202 family)